MREGHEITAVFQTSMTSGAYIRVAFDSDVPTLPEGRTESAPQDSDFWPDEVPPDI